MVLQEKKQLRVRVQNCFQREELERKGHSRFLPQESDEIYQRSFPIAQRSKLARYSRNKTMRIATARRARSCRSSVVA